MKNGLLKICHFIKENQHGLFKISVIIIFIYWSFLLKGISVNLPYITNSTDNYLSDIHTELKDIKEELSNINMSLHNR
jgi:hypothetical protein